MGLLSSITSGVRGRVQQNVNGFLQPKGPHAKRIEQLSSGYTLLVIVATLLLMGATAGKGYLSLVLLLAGALTASKMVQREVMPILYANLAPRLGWPTWEAGWAADKAALEAEAANPTPRPQGARNLIEAFLRPAATPAAIPAPPAPAPVPTSNVDKAVAAWSALDPERRLARAADVANFVKDDPDAPSALTLLSNEMPQEDRNRMANDLLGLMAMAKQYKLAS